MNRQLNLLALLLLGTFAASFALADDMVREPSDLELEVDQVAPDGKSSAMVVQSSTISAQEDDFSSSPLHLTQFESLEDLMIQMDMMHDRCDDRNLTVALRSAKEVSRLNRGSLHESFAVDEEDYQKFALSLWEKNKELQIAIESRDKRKMQRAFQGQARSCRDCHKQYRKDED